MIMQSLDDDFMAYSVLCGNEFNIAYDYTGFAPFYNSILKDWCSQRAGSVTHMNSDLAYYYDKQSIYPCMLDAAHIAEHSADI